MIVCYSKKLNKRVAIDTYLNTNDGDKHYLIVIGEAPLYTFILIQSNSLKEAYDTYCQSEISNATRITQENLDARFIQNGRRMLKGGIIDMLQITHDIEASIMLPEISESDGIDMLNDFIDYLKELKKEISNANEWDDCGPYNNKVTWLKDKTDPHYIIIVIEEEIPIDQFVLEHPETPRALLENKPFTRYGLREVNPKKTVIK